MSRAKQLIDELIQKKANGNNFQEMNIKMKLMFKGIVLTKIEDGTADDDEVIPKIFEVAEQFNVELTN